MKRFIILILLSYASAVYSLDYAGIPTPDWGGVVGDPIKVGTPAPPSDWTSEVAGYYFVNNVSGSDNNRYGTPNSPRRTIPNPIPAGAYVEVQGSYTSTHMGGSMLRFQGTSTEPCWLVGNSAEQAVFSKGIEVTGSYFVFDNVKFAATSRTSTNDMSFVFLAPVNHALLRNSTISGNNSYGGIIFGNWGDGGSTSNVVIYNNRVIDNGNWQISSDQDRHGITIGGATSNIWIVDNEFARNSGDGIQINGSNVNTHHIYIAGNTAHENKQTGFWVKNASDVIVSTNTSYLHRASGSSAGDGMGGQYDHNYVWFINNKIYDCENGIRIASTSDGGNLYRYIIGNTIYDIRNHGGPYTSAIAVWAGANTYIVDNTLDDSDAGISTGLSYHNGNLQIYNNIFNDLDKFDIKINSGSLATGTKSDTNLFKGQADIIWGDGVIRTLGGVQNTYNTNLDSITTSGSVHVNEAANNYELSNIPQPLTPINNGTAHSVYETFKARYGMAINVDVSGDTLPQGAGHDIGAFEFNELTKAPPSPPIIVE
jgi:hypothetical protein